MKLNRFSTKEYVNIYLDNTCILTDENVQIRKITRYGGVGEPDKSQHSLSKIPRDTKQNTLSMANDRMPHPANPRIILTANLIHMRQHILT